MERVSQVCGGAVKADNDNKLPESRSAAKIAGSARYFTGKLCRNGHLTERRTSDGKCVDCAKLQAEKLKERHPDYHKQWATKNKESIRQATRSWQARNPLKTRANIHNYKAKRRQNGGRHSSRDLLNIISSQNYRCAECGAKILHSKDRHLDHIKPVSRGGTNDKGNLQFLCIGCNLSKGAKDPIEFARSKGRLL